jgi:hypothetical protein
MFKQAIALCLILAGSSIASAAIVYEPVQYQHRGICGEIYYYGGRNPDVVADARLRAYALRHSDPNHQPAGFTIRTDRTPAVYSDVAPYMNLSIYGYTSVDAANEANANLPRYFRKGDLLEAGYVDQDGSLIVPANTQPLPTLPRVAPTTRPSAQAIIIIPKPPKAQPSQPDTKVASAR